ncbi:MAG: CBS domain-containing protein [Bellilinea sp.]
MHVILTHEQADFDAIASLLAARILNERAYAVLPRRVNRNVRAFLNLYGAELPFVEARDLPSEPIETITLVDTQSLITLKGQNKKTRVHVVDHHQLRDDLPADWTIVNDRLGACTTILAEDIRDHNGPLSVLQATTLLLGIYEDSGSLTYISTTSRDVRTAAYLLDQGASLRIATDFLNPPLSEEQREIYNTLLQSAETVNIHGQNIVIACTEAQSLNEEISSIAHKLRDLLDPDALFLLVGTAEGVRLVARSTTDRVNVAEVAARFGGGGHERASAALVRQADIESDAPMPITQAYQKLLALLPEVVEPALTVGRIMSRGARVLSPETSAQEAGKLMQRYGYEGYPVVKDNRVIGLLTRRAVDRAQSHRLNLPAASLMEAGEITVTPRDTIEHLQRLMAETGWGQVPVVDSEDGHVIGIVTRTDLLKTIGSGEALLAERNNLAERLEAALPEVRIRFLKAIAEQAHKNHSPIYIVGGFVRDLILDLPSMDFDLVVEGDAIQLAKVMEEMYGGRVASHSRFGTAKWQISDIRESLANRFADGQGTDENDLPETLDFISARTEFYNYPTALPTVERGSIKLDLHRRDFTINTLALRLDGRHYGDLYDYWGGLNDLQKGLVRVLHSLSFVDDPTRMLRAVRFEQRFDFEIEARTRQLMEEAHDLLKQVSGDRLRHEFDLLMSESQPVNGFSRLASLGLLEAIHPLFSWTPEISAAVHAVLKDPLLPGWDLPESLGNVPIRRVLAYLVWFGQFPDDVGQSIAHRLRLSHHLSVAIKEVRENLDKLSDLVDRSPSRVVAVLDEISLPVLYAINTLSSTPEICKVLEQYVTRWRHVQPKVDGYALLAMGLDPGPAYRQILWALRAAWLDGKISTPEQESALLQQMLNSFQP